MADILEIQGACCKDCKIFTKDIEDEALQMIYSLLSNPIFKNSKIRIMPDVHAGKGITIGFSCPVGEYVNPDHVGVDIGCLDCNTEVMTPTGWIKISEYKGGPILQINKDTLNGKFIIPKAYIVKNCERFYHFVNEKGLDQMVSEEHKMLAFTKSKSKDYEPVVMSVKEVDDKSQSHTRISFATSFNNQNQTSVNLTDNEIKIDVMIAADARIRQKNNDSFTYEIYLNDERKINRCKKLLSKEKIPFKWYANHHDGTETIIFSLRQKFNKDLTKYYLANRHQLEIICSECQKWCTIYIKHHLFSVSNNEKNADVIQFAFSSCGQRAIKYKKKCDNSCDTIFIIDVSQNPYCEYTEKATIVPSEDGKKYCFTTDTGFFLARRNGKLFVTGNCGIESIFFEKPISEDKYPLFDHRLRKTIPMGFSQNKETVFDEKEFFKFINTEIQKAYQSTKGCINYIEFKKDKDIERWCNSIHMDIPTFYHSIGTLGGGNHFIEYDENEKFGKYALTVHTGSRNLGQKVHNFWAARGQGKVFDSDGFVKERDEFIASWKGLAEEIPAHINAIKAKYRHPERNGYLSGDSLKGYLTDMVICQAYAKFNRMIILRKGAEIADKICKGNRVIDHIASIHNYIDFNDMILRKGAIRSYKGERMVIPFNMKDGLAICEGKSNTDWNCTAPHGSGRAMSRSKAKKDIKLNTFKDEMKGIYSTSVCQNTLDEAPDAYKSTDEIINNIKDTCNILFFMKPRINLKDTTAPIDPWKK